MFAKTQEQVRLVHECALTSLCHNPGLQDPGKAGLGKADAGVCGGGVRWKGVGEGQAYGHPGLGQSQNLACRLDPVPGGPTGHSFKLCQRGGGFTRGNGTSIT